MLICSVAAGLLAGLVAVPADAWAQNRNNNNNNRNNYNNALRSQIQGQLQAARAQLERAKAARAFAQQYGEAAYAKVTEAEGRIESARQAFEAAESTLASATAALREVEARIEASQSAGSELGLAKAAFEQWTAQLRQEETRVLGSPEYQTSYAAADAAPNRSEQIAKVRREALAANAAYQHAVRRQAEARSAYERARYALFESNDDWKQVVEASKAAKAEHARAKDALSAVMLNKASASAEMRKAQRTIAAADAAIAQGEFAVRNLESTSRNLRNNNNNNRNRNNQRR
jgi:chromosome segregation ATPase